jgi:hypothetical protein
MSAESTISYAVRLQTEADNPESRVTVNVDAIDAKNAREQALAQHPGAEVVKVRKLDSQPSEPHPTADTVAAADEQIASELANVDVDAAVQAAEQAEAAEQPEQPMPSERIDAHDLKANLKRAQMSEGSDLTPEQHERALNVPESLKTAASIRKFILGGSSNGDGESRQRSPEHAPIAKAATELIRSNSPARAAISTRAVAATVQLVGRKDVHKLLGGITDEQASQFATGAVRMSALPDDVKTAMRTLTAQVNEAAQLKRFEARELAAIVVAKQAA